jgi:cellulase/cellobiase CelA1
VRDVAVVRSAARLSGSVLVAGDAVVDLVCSAGTYTTFDPGRRCDGSSTPPDVNAAPTPFTAAELTLRSTTSTPSPTPVPVPTPTPTPTPTARPTPTPTPTRTPPAPPAPDPAVPGTSGGGVEPPEPVPARDCTAVYTVSNHWSSEGQNWFQAQVVVTAGSPGVEGWAVTWSLPAGEQITSVWNARLGTSGAQATAENMSYNGSLRDGGTATFGFQGTAPGDAGQQVPAVTCTRTR